VEAKGKPGKKVIEDLRKFAKTQAK